MSLLDQFSYIEARSGNDFVNSNQHNYMTSQINLIATALQDYTQTNYPSIYNDPNTTFTSYLAMAYRGLEGTNMYNDYVSSLPNSSTSYGLLYSRLINGAENKCL